GLEYLRKSLAIYSSLREEFPRDADVRRELAEGYNSVGSALENAGDTPGTLVYFHKALPIYEELLVADPKNRLIRRSLSVVYQSISRTLFLSGDTKGAVETNQK